MFFLSLLLQCKFANSTLLSLLSFSNFITPYDAQASSAFSALIISGSLFTEGRSGGAMLLVNFQCRDVLLV